MKNNHSIQLSQALKQMRELSSNNIPFSIGFISCNTTTGCSKGYRVVQRALLRASMRPEQSEKADILIAYLDCDDKTEDKNRFFYYPLLMMFNGYKITL